MILQFTVLQNIIDALSLVFLRILFGIVIFLLGFIIGKLVARLVYKTLKEIEINEIVRKATGLKMKADHFISTFLSYAIYFLSLVAALDQVGLANIILYFLSAALIIIILLSFFISVRDFLPNLIAGIYLYRKDIFREGSRVMIDEVKGKILHIDLFQVKIETRKGDILYLPNSLVAKSRIKVNKK